MRRLPPESTRPATLFPYTTIFLSEAPFVEALLHEHHGRPVGEAGVGARREGGGLPLAGGDLFRRHLAGDRAAHLARLGMAVVRSEEHTSELQSLMRNSYAVFCLKKKIQ